MSPARQIRRWRLLLLVALIGGTASSSCRELGFTSRVLWRIPAPDGKSFAVCQEIPGFDGPGFDLRLEEAQGGVVRRLYQIGDGDPCSEMAWSPDGERLAVLSGHVARIRVVDVAQARKRRAGDTSSHYWHWPQFNFSTENQLRLGKDLRFVGPREIEFTTCTYDLRETQRSRGKVRRCTSPEVRQRFKVPLAVDARASVYGR
jgi:hypothetical protein